MKNIRIKCKLFNNIDIVKYHVIIFDHKNNLILDDYTNKLGCLYFKPQYYGLYNIIIIPSIGYKVICTGIYINEKTDNFVFSFRSYSPLIITFKLTDKNYKDLPIKEGKLFLWKSI